MVWAPGTLGGSGDEGTLTQRLEYYGATGCSLNIVFFPEDVVIFLTSASSAAALVFYLPGVCTHTHTEGKQSSDYFFKSEKTQYLMNTL